MDIKIINNFFSKTAYADFINAFDQPKWKLLNNVSTEAKDGPGLVRLFGGEDEEFYLSLFPVHVISRELEKEYYCHRMRFRITWPCENTGADPHIDCEERNRDFDITAIIYPQDSDGDTIIYDSVYPDPFNKEAEFIKFTPKANTCVIMMKKYWHHGMRPVKTKLRSTININLKEHKQ